MPVRVDARIMVVDDNATVRRVLRERLERAGCTVVEAADGAEALRRVAAEAPDLVILDLDMPVMDGFETCRSLRELPGFDHLPVLVLTGRHDAESVRAAFEAGATDFNVKPPPLDLLPHRLRFLLRASRAMEELDRSRERLERTRRIARLGYWSWQGGEPVLHHDLAELLGEGGVAAGERRIARFLHPDDREEVRAAWRGLVEEGRAFHLEHRLLLPGGRVAVVEQEGRASRAAGRTLLEGILRDVTEQRKADLEIRRLALQDRVTGLANQLRFEQVVDGWLARRPGEALAVLAVDFDLLGRINDALGQAHGDGFLRQCASRLAALSPSGRELGEDLARASGDEFLVAVPGLDGETLREQVERRWMAALERPFVVGGREFVPRPRVGIAVAGEGPASRLCRDAQAALRATRRGDGDRVGLHDPALYRRIRERIALESALRRAVERDEFEVWYQPQVRLGSGEVAGVEALVRWRRPGHGLVPPGVFIGVAEETGLVVALGERVLRRACADMRSWLRLGVQPGVPVAVNVSARQLRRGRFPRTVEAFLDAAGLAPGHLEIEVTESLFLGDDEAAVATLEELARLGCSIALDDFGTGYSSMSYLKRLPIDRLKLDRAFVADLPGDPSSAAIARAIIGMAHGLGLTVVAEGVETPEQRDFLADIGCDLAQGYLFARPMPEALLRSWLVAREAGRPPLRRAAGE